MFSKDGVKVYMYYATTCNDIIFGQLRFREYGTMGELFTKS